MEKVQNIWINKNKIATITPIIELEFKDTNVLVSEYPKEKLELLKIKTVFISGDISFDKEKAVLIIEDSTNIKIKNINNISFIHAKREDFGEFLYAVQVITCLN